MAAQSHLGEKSTALHGTSLFSLLLILLARNKSKQKSVRISEDQEEVAECAGEEEEEDEARSNIPWEAFSTGWAWEAPG